MSTHDIHEPASIPQAFLDSHYSQYHVMAALGIDEPTFWAMYTAGAIPRGVSLMALCHVPLIVWPHAVLDAWHDNGRPAEPGALELQNQVLHSLLAAFKDEGYEFPTTPPIYDPEMN